MVHWILYTTLFLSFYDYFSSDIITGTTIMNCWPSVLDIEYENEVSATLKYVLPMLFARI